MKWIKVILVGFIASFVFMFFTRQFGGWIGELVFTGGDPAENSNHVFTRIGLVGLSGIIVICTFIIVNKLNQVIDLLKNVDES